MRLLYHQWCSGKFGTMGTLGTPLPPSFPFIPFPSPALFPPFPYLPLPSPPLSGGNNFNDFPENQLTIDFAFLCNPALGTLLYHYSPLS